MQRRVKCLAVGLHFFEAGFGENAFKLLLDHGDAVLQCRHPALRRLRGGLRHFKMVEHGQQLVNQRGGGRLRGFVAFPRGALFEIFKIGGGAQQAVPMLVGLGRARLEFGELLRRDFARRCGHVRRAGAGRNCFCFLCV